MTANEYQKLAMRTEADQEVIRQRIFGEGIKATRLDNAVRGLSDEVGELNAVVKRWLEYGQPLDEVKAQEEIGDCLYRLAQACEAIGITLQLAMQSNITKLKARYPDGYSDYRAADKNRDLEKERQAIIESTKENHLLQRFDRLIAMADPTPKEE